MERGAWQADRPQPRGTGGKPYTGQDAAWHQQDVSGSMRHRRVCHGGEGAQRLPGSAPAGRVQVAQRGLCEAGRQDEEHSYWKYCVVYIYNHLASVIVSQSMTIFHKAIIILPRVPV